MATKVQRAVAILNAMADPDTVATALATKVANAFITVHEPLADISLLTDTQKAGKFIFYLRRHVKDMVRNAEVEAAAREARKAAAAAAEINIGTDT